MPKRSKKSQTKHDAEVRRIANDYKKKEFDVKADIKGFPQPDTIGGYRPDVVATKRNQRKIFEVETTESLNSSRDQKQKQAFRKAANRLNKTTFVRRIVKSKKD